MLSRRQMLQLSASSTIVIPASTCFAELLQETPRMTEGPFYPDRLPLDTDNDLLRINHATTAALGEVSHLSGRVVTPSGTPIRNACVEIWQVDNNGVYLHSGDTRRRDEQDLNFQGYGRFLTNSQGEYYFRTIKPVTYPGRTPHIHMAVNQNGRRILTTQLLIAGHPQNERDGVFRSIRDPERRKLVMTEFKPVRESKVGELQANFDVVIGMTPAENDDGSIS